MSRKRTVTLLLALLALLAWHVQRPVSAAPSTDIPGGTITTDTTWTAAGSPYIVQNSINIAAGATLTIEPGVSVQFDSFGDRLTILNGGELDAVGTAANPIEFTADDVGAANWDGMIAVDGSTVTLQHCVFDNGAWGNGGARGYLEIRGSAVSVQDCIFRNGADEGIVLTSTANEPTIRNVELHDNAQAAILQDTINIRPDYENITMSGNGSDAIVIPGGGTITLDTLTLKSLGVPYIVGTSVSVSTGSTLTLEAGVEWQFDSFGDRLTVLNGGTLSAAGTATSPIEFTATAVGAGNWDGMIAVDGSTVTLQHCVFDNGAWGSGGARGYLEIRGGTVSVQDCIFRNGADEGIVLTSTAIEPTIRNVELHDNAQSAILQDTINIRPDYENITMNGNGSNAIVIPGGGTITLDTLTLKSLGVPYIISTSVAVSAGATLALEAGVDWQFDSSGDRLTVLDGGVLNAIGSATNPVHFGAIATGAGNWDGIIGTAASTIVLRHCEFSDGGWPSGGADGYVELRGGSATIENCTFRDGEDEGIVLTTDGTYLIHDVAFRDLGTAPIKQRTINMQPDYDGLSAQNSGNGAIETEGGTLSVSPLTLVDAGLPYVIKTSVTVPNSAELTLDPGVTVQFNSSGDQLTIQSGGTLTAVGTETKPVVVTSEASTPFSWRGITFNAGATGVVQHCAVHGGGWYATAQPQQTTDGLFVIHSSDVSVRNCEIYDSARVGIRVNSGAQPALKDNIIRDNVNGVINTVGTPDVDASLNYWGHPSGPFHPTLNPEGEGNQVSDGVIFNPWYSSEELTQNDLAVIDVSTPSTGTVGDDFTFSYSVQNFGATALDFDWYDSVYLSADPQYSLDDQLLIRHLRTGTVAGNAAYTEQLTIALSGVTEGDYYVIVVADSRRTIPDGDFTDNERSSENPVRITVSTLVLDSSEDGTLAAERQRFYQLAVPDDADVLVSAEFPDVQNGALYMRRGLLPTTSDYDFAATSFEASEQKILLTQPAGGLWYIMLDGLPAAGNGVNYTITADELPFVILDSTPDEAGDIGSTTVTLNGSGFTPDMTVSLSNGSRDTIAGSVDHISNNQLLVTFVLDGAARGVYDLVASKAGETTTVNDALTVVAGIGGRLSAEVVMPPWVRSNRQFYATVTYENTGNADLPIRMLRVAPPTGGSVWPDGDDVRTPAESLQFLTLADGGPSGGVLAPGQRGEFRFLATIPRTGDTLFTLFNVERPASDTFDYAAFANEIRPNPAPDLWNDAYAAATASMGSTYGDYLTSLGAASDEARQYGLDLRSVRELWQYAIDRAMLALPADVRGQAHTPAGVPLARQQLLLTPLDESAASVDDTRSTTTWYDGSFALRGLANGSYNVTIGGQTPDQPTLAFDGAAQTGVALVANSGSTLSGFVRIDDRYAYLSNAIVTARLADGTLLAEAASTSGRFTLTNLPPDRTVYLSVSHPDYASDGEVTAQIDGVEVTGVYLNLVSGGSFSGRITLPDGASAANARIVIQSTGDGTFATSTAAADGTWRKNGLPAGTYRVSAHADGYGVTQRTATAINGQLVEDIDISLTEGATLNVTVRDSAGNSIAGANVVPALPLVPNVPAVTNGSGSVTLSELATGEIVVGVQASGYDIVTKTVTLSAGGTAALDVMLDSYGSISGVVRNPATNQPLGGVPVTLFAPQAPSVTVLTSADGSYAITQLPPGDYPIAIGSVAENFYRQTATVAGSSDVVFDFDIDSAEINGHVRKDGQAVSNASVSLSKDGEPVATTSTDANGFYRLLVLQAGTYSVDASSPAIGIVRQAVTLSLGDVETRDVAPASNSLLVQVEKAGVPVPNASIMLEQLDGGGNVVATRLSTSDARGTYTFDYLPLAAYRVQAVAGGSAPTEQTVTLSSSTQTTTLVLTTGAQLSGRVALSDNTPIELAQVVARNSATGNTAYAATAADGTYSIDTLATGTYDVWVTPLLTSFKPVQIASLNINGNVTRNVTVLEDGATVAGTVTLATNAPLVLRSVRLETLGGDVLLSTITDEFGAYTIEHAPAGTFALVVDAEGHAEQTVSVSIPASGGVNQSVTLAQGYAIGIAEPSSARSRGVGVGASFAWWVNGNLFPPTPSQYDNGDYRGQLPGTPPDAEKGGAARVAWNNAQRARFNMDNAWDAWNSEYELSNSRGTVNFAVGATKLAQIQLKLVVAQQIIARAQIAARAQAAGSGAILAEGSAAELAALSGAGSLLTDLYLTATSGDTSSAVSSLQDVIGLLATAAGDQGSVVGQINDTIAVLREVQDNYNELTNEIPQEQLDFINRYADAQYSYDRSAANFNSAIRAYHAELKRACDEDNEEEPEEPEPEDDEEDIDEEEPERRDSTDPNDITGPAGLGAARSVPRETRFEYLIQFENIASASAAAQEVVITHVIDSDMNLATFALGDFGFSDIQVPVPGGRTSYETLVVDGLPDGYFVKFSAELDPSTRTVTWKLQAINPETGDLISDPQIGFLPPNVTAPEGEGYTRYSIRPKATVPNGTLIEAQADIVFDGNESILTPIWSNTIGERFNIFLPFITK